MTTRLLLNLNKHTRRTISSTSTALQYSELSTKLRLAHRALLLVKKGVSEREAVARALVSNRNGANLRRETLALVIATVMEQDTLDRIVRRTLRKYEAENDGQPLFRLVAHVIMRSRAKTQVRGIERSLKEIAPAQHLSEIELLIGTLLNKENTRLPASSDSERISLLTHHSAWWVEYCFKLFGRAETIALLSSGPRPRYVRINPLRNRGESNLPAEVRDLSSALTTVRDAPNNYRLTGSPSSLSKYFASGLFQMQDLASFHAVCAGDPMPGENVLEVCAAPGAKTTTVAGLMKNRGRIVSIDYSRRRMKTWKREIERMGVLIAEPIVADGTNLSLQDSFDLVTVDPPCTGTGVFDRNPRMKWHLSPRSMEQYTVLQQRLLESSSRQVRKGGRILYCTCSLTTEENEQVIQRFLKFHPQFELRPILEGHGSPGLRGLSDCRRFYPHRDGTAGYFIARLQSNS